MARESPQVKYKADKSHYKTYQCQCKHQQNKDAKNQGYHIHNATHTLIPSLSAHPGHFQPPPINIPLWEFMPWIGLVHSHMHLWLFLHTIMGGTFPECVILWLSVRQTDTIDFWRGGFSANFPPQTKNPYCFSESFLRLQHPNIAEDTASFM